MTRQLLHFILKDSSNQVTQASQGKALNDLVTLIFLSSVHDPQNNY